MGALAREVHEETGLDTELRRFLAVLSYTRAEKAVFHTFAFLLDDVGGVLRAGDPEERVAAFREIRPADLPACRPLLGAWRDSTGARRRSAATGATGAAFEQSFTRWSGRRSASRADGASQNGELLVSPETVALRSIERRRQSTPPRAREQPARDPEGERHEDARGDRDDDLHQAIRRRLLLT